MATLFREPNKVRWFGVRPAHDGVQIVKRGLARNATVITYTVTAGKTLYLCSLTASLTTSAAGSEPFIAVRNDADVLAYYLVVVDIAVAASVPYCQSYWPPIEIPGGWDIYQYSPAAACYNDLTIHGWEE